MRATSLQAPPGLEAYRDQARAAAGAVATLASRSLPEVWDGSRESFERWANGVVPLAAAAGRRVTTYSQIDYRIARAAAGINEPLQWIEVAVQPAAMRASLWATAFDALQQIEIEPAKRMERARIDSRGAIVRQVMNAGRNSTIATAGEDRRTLGAVYVTKGDAKVCYWCAMLSSRVVVNGKYLGPIFKADSFEASDASFIGSGTAKTHDHCRCVLRPVYDLDDPLLLEAKAMYDRWLEATKGFSGKAKLRAWRRAYNLSAQPV